MENGCSTKGSESCEPVKFPQRASCSATLNKLLAGNEKAQKLAERV